VFQVLTVTCGATWAALIERTLATFLVAIEQGGEESTLEFVSRAVVAAETTRQGFLKVPNPSTQSIASTGELTTAQSPYRPVHLTAMIPSIGPMSSCTGMGITQKESPCVSAELPYRLFGWYGLEVLKGGKRRR
jgi:hypothetical protein